MEAWSSPDALKKCKKELEGSPIMEKARDPDVTHVDKVEGPGTPSVLWNAMIRPFINMTIKGAVWYQGEANAGILGHLVCRGNGLIIMTIRLGPSGIRGMKPIWIEGMSLFQG